MPDNTQTINLDASGLISALAQAEAALKSHNDIVGDTAKIYLDATQKTKGIEVAFKTVSAEGVRLQGVLKEVNGQWEAQFKSVTKVDDALKALKASQLQAGATNAQQFLTQQNVSNAVPPDFQNQLRTAQQQLAKALAGDATGGLNIAQEIFTKLQQGIVDVEIGVRGKIQQALLSVLNVQRQITAEQEKQAKASAPAANVDPAKLAQLKSQIQQAFAIPVGASLPSIIQFQNALNNLINVAAKGKVELADVARILNGVNATPGKDFAGTDVELQKVQSAAQRLVQSFGAMGNSAQTAGQQGQQAARSLFISFDQFLKIIEIQIVHRIFGNLITGMQNSIGAAAELQVKISEIRTVAQESGISFAEFQQRIRALSEEFNRPQADIAAAAYQAFSNQLIKSASDMSILNEALRLSRITVSSAVDAVNLLSNVMIAYSLNATEASRITDQLFKAIEIGRFVARDVADSLGRITVTAAQVGVSFSEVSGLLAVLTRSGVSSSEALTQISSIINALSKPTAELSAVFRRLGFDSGLSAVQTLGFVGTLQLLQKEAERGNQVVGQLFSNIRAARAFRGATAGGGTGGLEDVIREIENAGPSADRAFTIVAESAGDAFRKELIKIQNFFTNDFANGFLTSIQQLTEPFGGLSGLVKSFGSSIIDIVSVLTQFAKVGLGLLSTLNDMGISVGDLVKIFIAYKVATLAMSTATTLVSVATGVYNTAVLALSASQKGATAVTGTAAAATAAQDAATKLATLSSTGYGVITTANTAAIATFTRAQIAGAIATRALSFALLALPIVAVVAGLAFLLGAFDQVLNKGKGFDQQIAGLQSIQQNFERQFEQERQATNRRTQQATQEFNRDLDERSRSVNRVITELSRLANEAIDIQREVVKETTENLKQAADAVRTEMSHIISELNRKVSESNASIRQSLKRESEFADRESRSLFERRLAAAGRQPEVISGLRPRNFQEQQIEDIQRQGRAVAFDRERQLIQQRLAELTRSAQEDTARGDQVSIESARRKFEEIRRLTEQLFSIETERGRQIALDTAGDAARQSGLLVTAAFEVNLQRLQAQLDAITAQERAAEQAFRDRQAENAAEARRRADEETARQQRIRRALQEITNLSVVDEQGATRERFRGPQGQQRFQQDFAAAQARLEEALQGSSISPDTILNLQIRIGEQRRALAQQLERQITQDTLSEIRTRFQAATEESRRAQSAATGAADRARADIATAVTSLPQTLQTILQNVEAAAPSLAGAAFGNDAAVQLRRLRNRIIEEQEAAARAVTAFNDARGTEREGAALQDLNEKVRIVTESYREFLRARFGTEPIPGGTRTGVQEAAQPQQTEAALELIRSALERTRAADEQLRAARARVAELDVQIRQLNPNLQQVAAGLGEAGQAAAAQAPNFNNLAASLNAVAAAVERLRNAGPLPAAPQIGAPAAPAVPEGGFAGGGMIGNAFAKNGPDDTLIWAKKGEFVVKPESTRRFYSQLVALNAGRMPRHYAEGGVVTTTNVGDVTIHVDGSKSPESTARAVLAHMKREFRKGNG